MPRLLTYGPLAFVVAAVLACTPAAGPSGSSSGPSGQTQAGKDTTGVTDTEITVGMWVPLSGTHIPTTTSASVTPVVSLSGWAAGCAWLAGGADVAPGPAGVHATAATINSSGTSRVSSLGIALLSCSPPEGSP